MCTMLVNDRRHTVLRLAGVGCCVGVEQVTPIASDICAANGWREVSVDACFAERPVVDVELPEPAERFCDAAGRERLRAATPVAVLRYRSAEVHVGSRERLLKLRRYVESTDRRRRRNDPFLQQLPGSIIKSGARRAVLKRIDALLRALPDVPRGRQQGVANTPGERAGFR